MQVPLQNDPVSKYPVFYLRSRDKVGETEITQDEFETWIALMNETDFQCVQFNNEPLLNKIYYYTINY
jgi:hypothetical protein